MARKVRVFGRVSVEVSTVVELDDDREWEDEDIFDVAYGQFGGVVALVGNGGLGDKMIGVNGKNDTITADGEVEFERCEPEE